MNSGGGGCQGADNRRPQQIQDDFDWTVSNVKDWETVGHQAPEALSSST